MQAKMFYSPAEVARELGISPTTVLRLIHAGRLPAIRVSERIYRIPSASYEKYMSGTLEEPFTARLGSVKPRPHLGQGERLPERAAEQAPARAR